MKTARLQIPAAFAVAVWLLPLDAQAAAEPPATAERPNVLFIVADDMGFSDAGCYGGEIETPKLDRLAAGGLRSTQFYNTARCWPGRSCPMTGCYFEQASSARQARTVAHYLKAAGCRCYDSGKWHKAKTYPPNAPRPSRA